MKRYLLSTILLILMTVTFCYSQNQKLNWGISAPILSTTSSKELAISRNLNDSYMLLIWGGFYYDKNKDVTPNQDLFENLSYSAEMELRKGFMNENKIKPYLGIALKNGYSNKKYTYAYPENYPLEYTKTDTVIKQIGMSLSFGAEYFITPSISIFAHTRLFYLYYNWEDGRIDHSDNPYYDDERKENNSIRMKGFERSTLYIRFYF